MLGKLQMYVEAPLTLELPASMAPPAAAAAAASPSSPPRK